MLTVPPLWSACAESTNELKRFRFSPKNKMGNSKETRLEYKQMKGWQKMNEEITPRNIATHKALAPGCCRWTPILPPKLDSESKVNPCGTDSINVPTTRFESVSQADTSEP